MIVDCKTNDNFFINRSQTSVELYFKEIRKYPVLSADEQRELLIKAKTGDGKEAMDARDKLVKCNQLFVASMARKFQTDGNFLDIVNEGNIGLLTAIDRFDLSKEQRFLTYAVFWIRKKMNDYNANVVKMITPKNATKLYTYVRKARNDFFLRNERYPSTEELQEILKMEYNVSVKEKGDLEPFEMSSIYDHPANSDTKDPGNRSAMVMRSYYSKSSTNNVDDDIDREETETRVNRMLSMLDERARKIVEMMYGIGTDYETSPETIAETLGISVLTVKKIANESLKIMRKNNEF